MCLSFPRTQLSNVPADNKDIDLDCAVYKTGNK